MSLFTHTRTELSVRKAFKRNALGLLSLTLHAPYSYHGRLGPVLPRQRARRIPRHSPDLEAGDDSQKDRRDRQVRNVKKKR